MKDSYSFDLTDEGLAESYRLHRDAYVRIFDRLGLRVRDRRRRRRGRWAARRRRSSSAVAETGEDTFVRSPGGYAANVEAVTTPAPPARSDRRPARGAGAPHAEHARRSRRSSTSSTVTGVGHDLGRTFTAADTLKNVLLKTRAPGATEWTLLGVGVPGDREVDMKRLEAALDPAEVALLDEADFAENPFLVKGYIGPAALAANGVRYLVDPRVVTGTAWVTGADKPDHHVVDLVAGRDFTPDGTIEAAEVRAGDPAPDGSGPLVAARGIEIGHVFQLGRKYTDALGLDALGPEQQADPHHDGLVRRRRVAAGRGDRRAERRRARAGVAALGGAVRRAPGDRRARARRSSAAPRTWPPRSTPSASGCCSTTARRSPGVKFADAELIGVPTIVVVGRGMADGRIEVKDRAHR